MTRVSSGTAMQRLFLLAGIAGIVAVLLFFHISMDLVLVFAVGLLFLLVSLQSLDFIVLVMLLAVPLTPSVQIGPFPINADDLLPPYVLALVLLKVAILKRQPSIRSPITLPLVLFLVWGTLAYLMVNIRTPLDTRQTVFFLKWAELHFAFFIPFLVIQDSRQVKRYLWVMLIAADLVALTAVVQFFTGWPQFNPEIWDPSMRAGRVVATFSRPNSLSIFLIVNMAIAFYFGTVAWQEFGRHRRFFLMASSVLMFLANLATGSRSGLLSIVVLLILGLRLRHVIPWFIVVAALVSVGAVAGLFLGSDFGTETFLALLSTSPHRGLSLAAAASDPRWVTWVEILPMILDSPILGYGSAPFTQIGTAHNYFLFIALAIGIPGMVLAFVIFWKMLTSAIGYARRAATPFLRHLAAVFTACLVAMYANSLFSETMNYSQLMIQCWFIFGMIVMGDRLARRENEERAWQAARAQALGQGPR